MEEWYINARKNNEIMSSVEAGVLFPQYRRYENKINFDLTTPLNF